MTGADIQKQQRLGQRFQSVREQQLTVAMRQMAELQALYEDLDDEHRGALTRIAELEKALAKYEPKPRKGKAKAAPSQVHATTAAQSAAVAGELRSIG